MCATSKIIVVPLLRKLFYGVKVMQTSHKTCPQTVFIFFKKIDF